MLANTWKAWLKGSKLDRNVNQEENFIRPLWTVDLENEEAILDWHTRNLNVMEDRHNRRTSMYVRNRDLYAGVHNSATSRVGILADPLSEWGTAKFKVPEIVINDTFELTEQLTAKLSRFNANVDVLPVNVEEGDRNAARASQRFTDHVSETHNIKTLFIEFIRDSKIGGESYIFLDWDPNVGDKTPAQKKVKPGERVPLLNEGGEQIVGEDGEPLYIEKVQRVGDFRITHRSVPEVLVQPKKRWNKVEWVCEIDPVDVDELKALYPDKAGFINDASTKKERLSGEEAEISNVLFCYTYWHKGVQFLDSGRKIVLVDGVVLFNDVNPFSGTPLPCIRLTDIDLQGELHGWSFINNIAIPQLVLNKLFTHIYKKIALGAHIYWLIPANARVARDKISNSSSVIQYFGVQKPEIATFNTVRPEEFQLIDRLRQGMLNVSRVQATSRGELPPNVEAGVAISILEEQENQAMTPDIKKVNAAIEKFFKLMLGIAGDKFEKDDGRTARILGKEGEFLLETIDKTKLSGPYDIKVRKATALSQSKALMVQQITQLEAMRPGIFSNAMLYDLLELGDINKFYDVQTAARRAAEFENERLKEGSPVPEPTKDEFLLIHWESHMTLVQSPSFKMQASEETRRLVEEHVIATEFFLVDKAKSNIALAQKLAMLEYFPAYYVPDFAIPEILAALQQAQILPMAGQVEEEPPLPPGGIPPGADELAAEEEVAPAVLPGEMGESEIEDQLLNGEAPEQTGPLL